MLKKNFAIAFSVSSALLLNACESTQHTMDSIKRLGEDSITSLKNISLPSIPSDAEVKAERYLYDTMPIEYQMMKPYIRDKVQFANFIKKYSERRFFSEQETLEAIIQLGIPTHAPEWLTSDAKVKIDKMMKEANAPKVGEFLTIPRIQIAKADLTDTTTGTPIVSDVSQESTQIAMVANPAMLEILFIGTISVALLIQYNAMINLHTSLKPSIRRYMTPAAVQAIEAEENKICQSPNTKCTSDIVPSDTVVVGPGNGSNKKECDEPPNPPMYCYRYDPKPVSQVFCADTGKKGLFPHYNIWVRNNAGNGNCYWNNPGDTHAICEMLNIPKPNAPCSTFPSFR